MSSVSCPTLSALTTHCSARPTAEDSSRASWPRLEPRLHRPADTGLLQHAGRHAGLAPRRVADPPALAVTLGCLHEFQLELGQIDLVVHGRHLARQVHALLDEIHAVERIGLGKLVLDDAEALLDRFWCPLAATLRLVSVDRFQITADRSALIAASREGCLVLICHGSLTTLLLCHVRSVTS